MEKEFLGIGKKKEETLEQAQKSRKTWMIAAIVSAAAAVGFAIWAFTK